LELASGDAHDVYLVDYDLGLHSGLDLLEEAMAQGCTAPMIVLTGMGDRSVDNAAMMAGAADYLLKGHLDASMLEMAIRYRARGPSRNERLLSSSSGRPKRWRRSASSQVASLTTSITCSPRSLGTRRLVSFKRQTRARPSPVSRKSVTLPGGRAADLTKQLLSFSKGRTQETSILDLNEVVKSTQRILSRLIGEDIEQHTVLPPGLWLVKSDPRQLEQIVINLAINARDSMESGGRLVIETSNVTLGRDSAPVSAGISPGRYVVLSVSDNGSEIDEDVLPHIFEPFFSTKDSGKGTGLGLSTCYGIVQQINGHILAQSESGAGTTIKVYLPRENGRVTGGELHEPQPPDEKGTESVLLVEDEETVRSMASWVLRDQGYTVIEAENGEEAIRLAESGDSGAIDLLLTDVVMPIMGGKELADRLVADSAVGSVLYTSGYAEAASPRFGQLHSGAEFMPKPFTPKTLIRRVRETLDASRLKASQDDGARERINT